MTPAQRATLLTLSAGRVRFAPDADTGRIHRALVMAGYAACRVEFTGEYISISEQGIAEMQKSAQAEFSQEARR